jgi:hypothetical protein
MQHLNVAIKYIEHSGKGTGERPEEVMEKYMHLNTSEGYFFRVMER